MFKEVICPLTELSTTVETYKHFTSMMFIQDGNNGLC